MAGNIDFDAARAKFDTAVRPPAVGTSSRHETDVLSIYPNVIAGSRMASILPQQMTNKTSATSPDHTDDSNALVSLNDSVNRVGNIDSFLYDALERLFYQS